MVLMLPETDRDVLRGIYCEIADCFEWNKLLFIPDRDFADVDQWLDYVLYCSWFYAGYHNGRFAGYCLLADITDQAATIHFCLLPGFPAVAVLQGFRCLLPTLPPVLEAYIPATNESVARLARILGFRVTLQGDWFYGRRKTSKSSGTTACACAGCAGIA
jgi:hypothetical protein